VTAASPVRGRNDTADVRSWAAVVEAAVLGALSAGFGWGGVTLHPNTGAPGIPANGAVWPHGRITVRNDDVADGIPFVAAIHAWNTSGAAVRFTIASRGVEPDIVVRIGPAAECGPRAVACAPIGYAREKPGVVWVVHRLDRQDEAHVLVHELGHVIGLTHRPGCNAMNPDGDGCPLPPPGEWRCRLLERVDLARAVRLYGGEAARVRTPANCLDGRGFEVEANGT
jgi:hypothetical protein